jgi:hypothetical protein
MPTTHGRAVERAPLPALFAAQGRVTSCDQRPKIWDFRPGLALAAPLNSEAAACRVSDAAAAQAAATLGDARPL